MGKKNSLKKEFNAPYKFQFGVLDSKTDTKMFDIRGLSLKQAEKVWREIKLKFR
jgi:hypothetical protein